MNLQTLSEIFTREHLTNIFRDTSSDFKRMLDVSKYLKHIRTACISQIVGELAEQSMAVYYTNLLGYEVVAAGKYDNLPDLRFSGLNIGIECTVKERTRRTLLPGTPVEFKLTNGPTWRGGEFSDRISPHILISYNSNTIDEFFACLIPFNKPDWKSAIDKGYYGPTISWKMVRDNPETTILFGGVSNSTKNGKPTSRGSMIREKV
jgi:hypothetical protein